MYLAKAAQGRDLVDLRTLAVTHAAIAPGHLNERYEMQNRDRVTGESEFLERTENPRVVDSDFFRKPFPVLLLVKLPSQVLYQLRFLLQEVRFLATFPDFLENPLFE